MPPRTRHTTEEPATTGPTRNLPQNADALARLLEQNADTSIIHTGLPRRNELTTIVRNTIDPARAALQFLISSQPDNFGQGAIPDFILSERTSTDFSRLSSAIREGSRRARFR